MFKSSISHHSNKCYDYWYYHLTLRYHFYFYCYILIQIGIQAFYGFIRLTSISIPTSVKSIGINAFAGTSFTCIKDWNPTTNRTIATTAFATTSQMTTCICTNGKYPVQYVCTACEVGYYCYGGVKYACSTGSTTSSTGATSSTACNVPTPTLAPTYLPNSPTPVPTSAPTGNTSTLTTSLHYYYNY